MLITATSRPDREQIHELLRRWEQNLPRGKRGNTAKRQLIAAIQDELAVSHRPFTPSEWAAREIRRGALGIARMAGQRFDEHGSHRGDHLSTVALDYVPPEQSAGAPYHDHGGAGLALVSVSRKRVYANSSKWGPSHASTTYLVGRNEAGTWFAHPTLGHTVRVALDWIWGGRANAIIARQGDIALIRGTGPKLPVLPAGHRVHDGSIVHATHPPLRLPGVGERIIVARQPAVRVSDATRD